MIGCHINGNLFDEIKGAVEQYVSDVKSVDFPNEKEQY
jgi:3-methyl-2-oxobutanoate hydroxymethyltransferase